MNIIPKLSLNKHPKDNTNLSLVDALNVKISNDESCITNEESIHINSTINDFLKELYNGLYKIKGIIPCNTELVLLTQSTNDTTKLDIIRYREKDLNHEESIYCAYGGKNSEGNFVNNRLNYHGGELKGTFTYNVENNLIIAISEYNTTNDELIPLKTINLGTFKENNDNEDNNDKNLSDSLLSIVPEVKIPSINNINYVKGNTYKGWYYLFIRYKINKNDYTQWYSFGYPIYSDTLVEKQIVRYCFGRSLNLSINNNSTTSNSRFLINLIPNNPTDGFGVGCSDHFSDETDISNELISINLSNLDTNYKFYQIGIIIASKSYTKSYRSNDISIDCLVNNIDINNYIEYTVNELTNNYYNYYNVKNIINYKNRLYISNYKEKNTDNKLQKFVDNLDLKTNIKIEPTTTLDEYTYLQSIKTDNLTPAVFDNNSLLKIYNLSLAKYLNIDDNTNIRVSINIWTREEESTHTSIIEETRKAKDFYIVGTQVEGVNEGTFGKLTGITEYTQGYITIKYINNGTSYYLIPAFSVSYGNPIYTITNLDTKISLTINRNYSAVLFGSLHINTNKNFKERITKSTLIPGEVYNFFIHFIDKYGEATKGYKLTNKKKIVAKESIYSTDIIEEDIIPIPITFQYRAGDPYTEGYIYANINESISETIQKINNDQITTIYEEYDATIRTLYSPRTDIEFINLLEDYKEYIDSDFKWFEIVSIKTVLEEYPYSQLDYDVFINNNGDRLFKVPYSNVPRLYYPNFENIIIPDGYVGYFISYEKPEYIKKVTGILSKCDFKTIDYGMGYVNRELNQPDTGITPIIINSKNTEVSNKTLFFSSYFDIEDSIELNYNLLRIENDNFDNQDVPNYTYRNNIYFQDYCQRNSMFEYMYDLNKVELFKSNNSLLYTPRIKVLKNYNLCIANSIKDNRADKGTCLSIEGINDLFNFYKTSTSINNKIKIYKVSLLNSNRNIYTTNNKKLIRISENIYDYTINNNIKYSNVNIKHGLDGHYTYRGTIVYNGDGFIFNETNNVASYSLNSYPFYPTNDLLNPSYTYRTYNIDNPMLSYIQTLEISNIINESKSFKNSPKNISFVVNSQDQNAIRFYTGCIVTPANSIDLFENKQGSSDDFNPKTYTNYREDILDINNYNKTIRRSNIIQDESRINSWREFPLEGYKNITENKGIITNLIGIGTMLLVHTEHSLFMFDTSNELQTVDQSIQLSQPDAFEVDYKEIFTSDLGFGGLQDNNAAIVDQFGYIFYDNSNNHFYQFDNKQLAIIDNDIIEWLLKYKPYNVRFANDKVNNRLLITMTYNVNDIEYNTTLSYNYNIKSFISFHSYTFDKAYNTKSKLYFIKNIYNTLNQKENSNIYSFSNNSNDYCDFTSLLSSIFINNNRSDSKISIIINNDFDIIKYLEYISYKLSKISKTAKNADTYSPVEEYKVPFSGNKLIVYNNEVNTGELNIEVNDENNKNIFGSYDKPYWDLGNWNFSYLRNKLSSYPTVSAIELSRLYGNYFIVEFIFNNGTVEIENEKIEFESLTYKLSK